MTNITHPLPLNTYVITPSYNHLCRIVAHEYLNGIHGVLRYEVIYEDFNATPHFINPNAVTHTFNKPPYHPKEVVGLIGHPGEWTVIETLAPYPHNQIVYRLRSDIHGYRTAPQTDVYSICKRPTQKSHQ